MKFQFIGTSSGQTRLDRYHSSILFSTETHNMLVDAGDSTARALLAKMIPYNSIDSILFSHYHSDHFAGVASLITQMKLTGRDKSLTIYTHAELETALRNFLSYTYLFPEAFSFALDIKTYNQDETFSPADNISVTPKQNTHIVNKHDPAKRKDVVFLSSSFHIAYNNRNIIYTADIGSKKDLYLFNDIRTDIYIAETTHVKKEEFENLLTILDPGKLYLTHISTEDEHPLTKWREALPREKREKVILAYDGLTVSPA